MAYKSFEDLDVWQRSCRLAVEVFEEFRGSDFINLKNQIERSALSIASNVDFNLTDFTADSFNDLVLKERGYETQYEAKRWLDLKRLGVPKLKQVIKAATGKDIADKHLFWPIPVGELNFNTALDPKKDQNPGY